MKKVNNDDIPEKENCVILDDITLLKNGSSFTNRGATRAKEATQVLCFFNFMCPTETVKYL